MSDQPTGTQDKDAKAEAAVSKFIAALRPDMRLDEFQKLWQECYLAVGHKPLARIFVRYNLASSPPAKKKHTTA